MLVQEININLIPVMATPAVNVSQYDKGSRVLKIHVFHGTDEYQVPDNAVAYIQGTKRDGTGFMYKCEHKGNVVTANVTDQMTVLPGSVHCELCLQIGTDKRAATANFIIMVKKSSLQDTQKISETEIPLIGKLSEAATKAVLAKDEAVRDADICQHYASYLMPHFIYINNRICLRDTSNTTFIVRKNRLLFKSYGG